MSICGLTCSPSRISCCMVSARKSSSSHGLVSSFTKNWSSGIRMKLSSCIDRIGAFFGSWLLSTFLMISVIPHLLQGPRSLEVSTSLINYILLRVFSTYLKK